MWNLDKDPFLTSVFANVTVLDCVPDREYLRRKLGRAVQEIPRLRQRVVPAFGRLAPPTWEDDETFDLDYHLRWMGLPKPGDQRALLELATRLHQQPFERGRPLWEFVVVEGLSGGRAAMIQKLHHTVTDGVGGLRLAERFLDLERSPAEPEGVPAVAARAHGFAGPSIVGRALGTAGHLTKEVATTTVDVAKGGRHHARPPRPVAAAGPRCRRDHPVGGPTGGGHQRSPVTALDRALPLAGAGRAPGALRRRQGRGDRARRDHQRPVRHRRRPGRRHRPPAGRSARGRAAHGDADEHAGRQQRGGQRLLADPDPRPHRRRRPGQAPAASSTSS